MMQSIQQQESTIRELEKENNSQKSCMYKFYEKTRNHFRFRCVLRAWKYYTKCRKQRNRVYSYIINKFHRRRQSKIYEGWKWVAHKQFKEEVDAKKFRIQAELESKMLTQWSTKVDALLLYMSQLEDKIKVEQEARQKLAEAYDNSLNNGFSRLNLETQVLQANPLINEVVIRNFEMH